MRLKDSVKKADGWLKDRLMRLSPAELSALLAEYDAVHGTKTADGYAAKGSEDDSGFLRFLEENKQLLACPVCHSAENYRHSLVAGRPRYKCRACGRTFSPFAGTLVQGSSWSWAQWVDFIHCTLVGYSLVEIQRKFADDYGVYLSDGTALTYRHKVMHAITMHYEMPKLSGVVQVDETYFREVQKGSLNLVSTIPTVVPKREARTRLNHVPAVLGTNGAEFACVVAAIDSSGHAAAVVTGLGKSTSQPFAEYFSEYLGEVSFLCSDGYEAYTRYCEEHAIPHYVQRSEARSIIRKEKKEWADTHSGHKPDERDIRKKLYKSRALDYLEGYGRLAFDEFETLKAARQLGLERVDHLHGQLKRHINRNMTGVNTPYLARYVGFYIFLTNWRVDHGFPPSSMADAESIFKTLLLAGNNAFSRADMLSEDIRALQKPPTKYINMLAKTVEELRQQSGQRGLTIDDNDRILRFNRRRYLETAPLYQLRTIGKEYHIKGYTRMKAYQLAAEISKLPDAKRIFLRLVAADAAHACYADDLSKMLDTDMDSDPENE